MELALLVWIISMLNGFTGLAIVGVTAFIGLSVIIGITFCEVGDKYYKNLKWSVPGAVICALIAIAIPSEKTAYTMVGAYAAQKVAEDPKVRDMSGKVLTLIEQKLDNYIDEGLKEAEKKVKK